MCKNNYKYVLCRAVYDSGRYLSILTIRDCLSIFYYICAVEYCIAIGIVIGWCFIFFFLRNGKI